MPFNRMRDVYGNPLDFKPTMKRTDCHLAFSCRAYRSNRKAQKYKLEIGPRIQTLQYDTFCPEINGMLDKSFWYIHFSKSFVHNILRQREIYCEFTERCPSVLIPTSFQSDGRERDCLRELNPTQLTKTLEFRATIDFNSDLVRTNRIPPTREGLPDERIKPLVRLDALRQQPSILIHGLTQVFTTKEDSNARSPSCR